MVEGFELIGVYLRSSAVPFLFPIPLRESNTPGVWFVRGGVRGRLI
ncbi:hypothetical protein PLANPX_2644 [Lacipirellula parvula]|uniref:Uncharacterized protein n=1 Tax=Lacipirellula parvula TaxID=2650471 RepID=A0A5K7XAQ8_9BACT|nr:hypothetical protein PLANPX_2644 [Lacipirellula parvula]